MRRSLPAPPPRASRTGGRTGVRPAGASRGAGAGSARVAQPRGDPGDRLEQRLLRILAPGARASEQLDLEVRERVDPRVAVREPPLQRGSVVQQCGRAGDLQQPADDLLVFALDARPEALRERRIDEPQVALANPEVGLVERHLEAGEETLEERP